MEGDFTINTCDLDGEWLKQPGLYYKWASLLALATKERDYLHLERKIKKAELYKSIKNRAEAMQAKITENAIEAELRSNPEYAEVSKKLIDAEERVNMMQAGKWAIVSKGSALEQLSASKRIAMSMNDHDMARPTKEESMQHKKEEQQATDAGLRKVLNSRQKG
jgi:hypothetical protein